jgi:uncharacterized protein
LKTQPVAEITLVQGAFAPSVLPRSAPSATHRPAFLGRIPLFPDFKPLEFTDQFAIESWVKQFRPYSDFNFVSLWCWNTESNIELSWLNDNLVVKFKDYGSPRRFYSFLGTNDVVATTMTLCKAARDAGLDARLQLIPETIVAAAPELSDWVQVADDRGQFDYVVSTQAWAAMAGGKFRKKRNVIHHLERTVTPEFRPIDAGQTETQRAIETVFGRWTVQCGLAGHDAAILQSLALRRCFSLDRPGDLLSYGVFIDGELCAYSINEPLPGGYAMGHFWRADRSVHGLYPYLLQNTCRALLAAGCHYLNTMQDLGQPGLAKAKGLDRPDHFLRKFSLAPLDDPELSADTQMTDESVRLFVEHATGTEH